MNDPYTYENGTLINKLNITNYEELNSAEADICFLKLINVDSIKSDNLNSSLIKSIHYHIFENIFDWAGEYRTISLYKEEIVIPGISLNYATPSDISSKLELGLKDLNDTNFNLDDLDELSFVFARKIALLWKIHPFRDGNTRTFLSFAYLFAMKKGFPFDIKIFTDELFRTYNDDGTIIKYNVRDKFVLASLDKQNYPEVEHLANLFKKSIESYQKEKEGPTK